MKVYVLKEEDFERLFAAIDRDPRRGTKGGSSSLMSDAEQLAHDQAHRFFNYQIRNWIDEVKR